MSRHALTRDPLPPDEDGIWVEMENAPATGFGSITEPKPVRGEPRRHRRRTRLVAFLVRIDYALLFRRAYVFGVFTLAAAMQFAVWTAVAIRPDLTPRAQVGLVLFTASAFAVMTNGLLRLWRLKEGPR